MAGPTTFISNLAGVAAVTANTTAINGPGSNGVHSITSSDSDSAVYGEHTGGGIGVFGRGGPTGGEGVFGQTASGFSGVYGKNTSSGAGVTGEAVSGSGIVGTGFSGVQGTSSEGGVGVIGRGTGSAFDPPSTPTGNGVFGIGDEVGVRVECQRTSNDFGGVGLWSRYIDNQGTAVNDVYLSQWVYAGEFYGNVEVHGTITKDHIMFKIDHPLDPAMKYLLHSGVESPDMKNIYDGVVVLDASGEAAVELPEWFEPLNTDFRYQLTPIGAPGPNLYIAEEISNHRFKIAGGTPAMKVSWQVTGIRQDAWAKAHPSQVEEDKPSEERGYYLHPELHGAPKEKSIERVRHPQRT
jgi:hypothetical protein